MTPTSLLHKIGQLFILGFAGDSIDDRHPILRDIEDRHLGGVILFDRLLAKGGCSNNIVNPEQVRQLTARLRAIGGNRLFIAVDQEGGMVNRFKADRGFPVTPPAAELGRTADTSRTREAARQTAAMLSHLGINWNFGPVVDLNLNPDNPIIGGFGRSFGEDWRQVTAHARVWIQEHRAHKVLTCLKHFPGHGSSQTDSHLGFVDISETWQPVELEPFARLVAEDMADGVMVGHLYHGGFDPRLPASLSPAIIHDHLRQRLGYRGPVIADDLQMQAITKHYSLADACCRAIAAGCDLLIIGNNLVHDPDILAKATAGVLEGLAADRISEEHIESAWRRVQTLKQQVERTNGTTT